MALTAGTSLGPYTIVAPVGAGGMGEVYRARDGRLGRDVAIKTISSGLAVDPERLRRFELEARAASLLSHPNILTIFDIGHAGGQPYIVSELLEGENLRQRLSRGALGPRQAVEITAAIADALAAAHARGIVHRDLKPENLFLTRDGRVKVLDFGVAKLTAPDVSQAGGTPTVTIHTDVGVAVGTLGYMAPEQLRGEPADSRADIFALGAVLHEMVSAAPAFRRESRIATVNAVLEADPPDLGEHVPPALRLIVRRCLEKDPEHRFQSARDLAFALRTLTEPVGLVPGTLRTRARSGIAVAKIGAAVALAALMLAAGLGWLMRTDADSMPRPVRRFSIQPASAVRAMALSPDGANLVYAAGPAGAPQLYLRPLGELDETAIAGTEGGRIPFFSPDGQWIAFATDDKLKKVRIAGGPVITLCDVRTMLSGAWGPDGAIVVSQREHALMTVSAEGGPLVPLTTVDTGAGEIDHHSPVFLPGGRAMLFTVHVGTELFRIAVRSLDTGEQRTLIDDGFDARYVASGHLVYGQPGALLAVPFDLRRLAVAGAPVMIVENALTIPGDGIAVFSVASDGTFVYQPAIPTSGRSLVRVHRDGRTEPLPTPPRGYDFPALSPDGQRLAVQIDEGSRSNIWIYDFATDALQRISADGSASKPIWAADGNTLIYASRRQQERHLVSHPLDASGSPRSLAINRNNLWPGASVGDGRVIFVEDPPTSLSGIKQVRGHNRDQIEPVVADPTRTHLQPAVSPDGQWIAYVIVEAGRPQILVRPLAGGTPRPITPEGGAQPRWTREGREITFRRPGRFMSVPVRTTPTLEIGKPQDLFADAYVGGVFGPPNYDVTADGQRFIVVRPAEGERAPLPIHVVENWFGELSRRVPAGR